MQYPQTRRQPARSLNADERSTLRRIEAHTFDVPGDGLTFSARLARENGWSARYTAAVMDEYRRFCFLAVHAGHPVTPSDQVDQAWHLHLTYTLDYWGIFCPEVLGTPLHHGPTRGGNRESAKYRDWYARTLESYERFFGPPPISVWPAPAARFRNAEQFVRVNTADRLTLPRAGMRRAGLTFGAASLLATATSAFAADGGGFPGALIFVLVILVGGVIMFMVARNSGGASRKDGGAFVGSSETGGKASKGGDADGSGCGGDGAGGSGCGGCGAG